MQQSNALFQIELLNVSVYLVSVCSVAEHCQFASSCYLWETPQAWSLWDSCIGEVELLLKKEVRLFGAVYLEVGFPRVMGRRAALALCMLRRVKGSF